MAISWKFSLLILSTQVCGLVVLAAPDPNPLKLPKDCGRVPAKRDRIAGGYFADDGAFPSYVRLVFEMRNRTDVKGSLTGLCGAIIISERLILTAAHCIRERRGDYRILVDLVSSRPGNSTNSRFEHMANTVCMPKHWLEVVPVKIDLAVVQLNRPLTFDKYTQPACLPDSRVDEQTQLFNVGMGSTANETISTNLKALRSKRAKCGRFHDQPTYICTQPSDAKVPGSACQGDSGGPLIAEVNGKQTAVGVASAGEAVCKITSDTRPAYVDLFASRDLLRELLQECSEYL